MEDVHTLGFLPLTGAMKQTYSIIFNDNQQFTSIAFDYSNIIDDSDFFRLAFLSHK